jgi:hypothetical protein
MALEVSNGWRSGRVRLEYDESARNDRRAELVPNVEERHR